MTHREQPDNHNRETVAGWYRLLLDALPHGVQINDCRGVITYSNKAHHQLLGYPDNELIGRHIWDFCTDPADRTRLRGYLRQLVAEQPSPEPYRIKNRHRDGHCIELQVDWDYERDASGELTGFVSGITDVTARQQTEEVLQQRAHSLTLLLEVSKALSATLDPAVILQAAVDGLTRLSGLDTAAVYLLEERSLELWATTPSLPPDFPEEMRFAPLAEHPHIGRTIETAEPQQIPDPKSVKLTPAERAVFEQRQLRTALFVPLVAEEQVIGVFIVGSIDVPVVISREIIALSTTLSNLTALAVRNAQLYRHDRQRATELQQALNDRLQAENERKKLQEALLQAQKMESIGRLAGGIAHDFNNMLSVILGHAELALRKVSDDHAVCPHLQQIRKATERSADLTRQLLGFARKQTIAPRLVDLNRLIENMLNMLQRLLGENIDLVWRPAPDPGMVMLDPSQVDQLLINLCVNARDAIDGPGKVTIETGSTRFDENYCTAHPGFQPGEYMILAVSDDGIGMDKKTLDNIFEPYFTTKTSGKGTGLGLSTVYGIVKQNGGFINVSSEPGRGSCFKVYLCRRQAADPPEIGPPAEQPASLEGHETILLVEDEQKVLDIEQEILEGYGYRVLPAASPQAAIALAEECGERIHLLITDVVMPQMNGQQLVEHLQPLLPGLKVLFLSGYTANVIAHHGVLHEGVIFLGKPFSKEQLAEKVRQSLLGISDPAPTGK